MAKKTLTADLSCGRVNPAWHDFNIGWEGNLHYARVSIKINIHRWMTLFETVDCYLKFNNSDVANFATHRFVEETFGPFDITPYMQQGKNSLALQFVDPVVHLPLDDYLFHLYTLILYYEFEADGFITISEPWSWQNYAQAGLIIAGIVATAYLISQVVRVKKEIVG